jgi:hypothetical protein
MEAFPAAEPRSFAAFKYAMTTAAWKITSRTKCPDFYLRDIWQSRELLLRFVRRDFLASYNQT